MLAYRGNLAPRVIGLRAPSGDDRLPGRHRPVARRPLARPGLSQGAAIVLLALLAGCGGTVLEMEGQICNQPVRLKMADAKDRSAFQLAVTCGPGGGVTVSTAESSASAVMAAQAEAIRGLAERVGRGP